MVELKMKINEIRARLGLEGEEIDEKKMVEIDRLHRKKIELEQKLNELAESMSKQKQKVGYIQNVRNFLKILEEDRNVRKLSCLWCKKMSLNE